MPSHPSTKHTAPWRSRREEYLRASGHQSDLVSESFEPAASAASWTAIAGGRSTHLPKPIPRAGLFLMKKWARESAGWYANIPRDSLPDHRSAFRSCF